MTDHTTAGSLVVALILLCQPGAARAQEGVAPIETATPARFDLRAAPAPAVGDVTRRHLRLAQSGVVIVKSGDKQINQRDQVDQGYTATLLEEVAALGADGRVERLLRTYEDVTNEARHGPFDQVVIGLQALVVRKPDGSEALADAGGAALDEKTQRLLRDVQRLERGHRLPVPERLVPASPAAPGDRWRLTPEAIAELLALTGVDILDPRYVDPEEVLQAEGAFVAAEQKDGVVLLHVAFDLRLAVADLEGVTFDPPADVVIRARFLTGGAASATRAFVAEGTFKGTLGVDALKGASIMRDLRFEGMERATPVAVPAPQGE